MPYRGFLFSDSFDHVSRFEALSGVMQNPALLGQAGAHTVTLDTSQDYFGYDRVGAKVVLDAKDFVVGVGYQSFRASDIQRTREDSSQPHDVAILDQFADQYDVLSIGTGIRIRDGLYVGLKGSYLGHKLDSDSAQAFSMDPGIRYRVVEWLEVGAHTRYLLSTSVDWSDSGVEESLDPTLVLDATGTYRRWKGFLGTDFYHHRFGVYYSVVPQLGVMAETVTTLDWRIQRYSYGIVLDFHPFALQFLQVRLQEGDLDVDQSLIGFSISWQ